MTQLMQWLYDHHIQPYIAQQPMDDGDQYRSSLLDCGLDPAQTEDFHKMRAFHAVHGFRLGLKLGLALSGELEEKSPN